MEDSTEFNVELQEYLQHIDQPFFYKVDLTNSQPIFFSYN
jgi:hypothetical protein